MAFWKKSCEGRIGHTVKFVDSRMKTIYIIIYDIIIITVKEQQQ